MTLLELAERCEKAEGPDRGLDAEIELATGNWSEHHYEAWWRFQECGEAANPCPTRPCDPRWLTTSIDAAMTLVPSECYWRVGHDGEGRDPSMFAARVFDPLTMKRPCTAVAETPALALCAAALRALEINHEQ